MKSLNNFVFIMMTGLLLLSLLATAGCVDDGRDAGQELHSEVSERGISDAFGRLITVPVPTGGVLCSGAGTLRYLVYLQGEELVIGVDSMEKQADGIEGRPYGLVHGEWLRELPLFGEFRGNDDPEKVIMLSPDLVFRAGVAGQPSALNAGSIDTIQEKSGIPYIGFMYGSLRNENEKAEMFEALRLMGTVIGKEDRAEEVIAYIGETMADLEARTGDIPADERKRVYIGGVGSRGAHGIISSEPAYPPFLWVHADNVASGLGIEHADVAKEALVDWDPEYLFIDVGTIQANNDGAIDQLRNDPALGGLSAVHQEKVYGLLPFNFYTTNHETILANAYFVGKVLYPERFADIDPVEKADEIYTFFVGEPVFDELNSQFKDLGFSKILI